MALQSSGYISLNDVNVELGNSGTASINMGSADVRGLFGVASGAITMADGYGKSDSVTPTRGVFGGGKFKNEMDYITIATTGNATDFGDLTVVRGQLTGVSSDTRGVFGGGIVGYDGNNTMDYITTLTASNATDFGDLTVVRGGPAGCSDGSRGVFGGGKESTSKNTIDYITIATTGNATDFGDLNVGRMDMAGVSSEIRGVMAGGSTLNNAASASNVMDYITIATTGNATDFGNLTLARRFVGGCDNGTRGVFASGTVAANAPNNTIDYITIATTGNATDFGNLSTVRRGNPGCSNNVRGVFGGGRNVEAADTNVMDYITIATTGNATDFGNLTVARELLGAVQG